ncbi:Fur-regulated basic protein FbpA [Bacillus nitroreducens]
MGKLLRHAIQSKKEEMINTLIQHGIYKKNNKQLYELTLGELEDEYKIFLKTYATNAQKEERVLNIH